MIVKIMIKFYKIDQQFDLLFHSFLTTKIHKVLAHGAQNQLFSKYEKILSQTNFGSPFQMLPFVSTIIMMF